MAKQSRPGYTLKNYYTECKKHRKSKILGPRKLAAIDFVEKQAKQKPTQKTQKQFELLTNQFAKLDWKIRKAEVLLTRFDEFKPILDNLGKVIGFSSRAKSKHILKTITKFREEFLKTPRSQIKKIEHVFSQTQYDGHDARLSLRKLTETVLKTKTKMKENGIEGITLKTRVIDFPGMTNLMKSLYDFYLLTTPKSSNNGFVTNVFSNPALDWTLKVMKTYWILPKQFSKTHIKSRLVKSFHYPPSHMPKKVHVFE